MRKFRAGRRDLGSDSARGLLPLGWYMRSNGLGPRLRPVRFLAILRSLERALFSLAVPGPLVGGRAFSLRPVRLPRQVLGGFQGEEEEEGEGPAGLARQALACSGLPQAW